MLLNFRTFITCLCLGGMVAFSSCKSQKLARQATAQEAMEMASKIDESKKTLNNIIDGTSTASLEEQAALIKKIKQFNLGDEEVKSLLEKAEAKYKLKKKAAEEMEKQQLKEKISQNQEGKLTQLFRGIAGSQSLATANAKIKTALQMFVSPDAPVLLIISQDGDQVDYDKPTTIKKYLNYLKDQKGEIGKIDTIVNDENGKIKVLELISK